MVAEGAGVVGRLGDGARARGPGEGVGARKAEGSGGPLAAARAEDRERPVGGVLGRV